MNKRFENKPDKIVIKKNPRNKKSPRNKKTPRRIKSQHQNGLVVSLQLDTILPQILL